MRNPMAVWLQVCMCTRVYGFLQGYVSSFGFASWAAGDVRGVVYDSHGCVQRARISLRCSIFANAKPVLVFVSLQLWITLCFLVSQNDGKCPSHKTTLRYVSRPTHQQLSISLSKTLKVKPWATKLLLLYMRESYCLVLTPEISQLVLKHSTFSSPSP